MLQIRKSGKNYEIVCNGILVTDRPTRRECAMILEAITGLIDWSRIESYEAFNALPVDTRQSVGLAIRNASMSYDDTVRQEKRDRLQSKLNDNARYADGVPFNQAPKPKPYKIPATVTVMRGMVDGREWHSDGYFAMEGAHPEAQRDAPIQQVIPTRFSCDLEPVAYYQKGARIAVMNNGTLCNYDMLNHILNRFPGATIRGNTRLSPMAFVLDGRTVASMMPMNPNHPIPDAVKGMIDA